MAADGKNNDAQNLLIVVGVALVCTMAAVFWLSENMQTRGSSQDNASFQAVQPIKEGTVRTCPTCQGKGRATCHGCGGRGKVIYWNVAGEHICDVCSGTKIATCYQCKGKGTISSAQPGVLRAGPKKQ